MISKQLAKRIIQANPARGFSYSVEWTGEGFEKRCFVLEDGVRISGWHDIEHKPKGQKDEAVFTGLFEVPKNRVAKMELATDEEFNPIKQDTNKNRLTGATQLRYYAKFPFFNYGMIP